MSHSSRGAARRSLSSRRSEVPHMVGSASCSGLRAGPPLTGQSGDGWDKLAAGRPGLPAGAPHADPHGVLTARDSCRPCCSPWAPVCSLTEV